MLLILPYLMYLHLLSLKNILVLLIFGFLQYLNYLSQFLCGFFLLLFSNLSIYYTDLFYFLKVELVFLSLKGSYFYVKPKKKKKIQFF